MIKPLADGHIKGFDRPPKAGRYLFIDARFMIDPAEATFIVTVWRGTGCMSDSLIYRHPSDGEEHIAAGPHGGTSHALWIPIESLQVAADNREQSQTAANANKDAATNSGKSQKKRRTV